MRADDFVAFLVKVGWSDAEAMRKLGIGSYNTMSAYKQNGGPPWLGLACAALAAGLLPWKSKSVAVYKYRVWSQQAGDYLLGQAFRTEESIQQIRGEILPGSGIYVDPADVREGRFELTDADRFYTERLLEVAAKDQWDNAVETWVSNSIHLHTLEGRGDRAKLMRLFTARAPETAVTTQILAVFERYL